MCSPFHPAVKKDLFFKMHWNRSCYAGSVKRFPFVPRLLVRLERFPAVSRLPPPLHTCLNYPPHLISPGKHSASLLTWSFHFARCTVDAHSADSTRVMLKSPSFLIQVLPPPLLYQVNQKKRKSLNIPFTCCHLSASPTKTKVNLQTSIFVNVVL